MNAPRRGRSLADPSLVGLIRMPAATTAPVVALLLRLVVALGSLFLAAMIVWLGGAGYVDNNSDTPISFNDAFYYATVSLSTTGYGDIVPVSPQARLVTTLVITPLRMLFLIVLVGTTVELLTERSRQSFRISRWRSRVRDHTIVVGYGTKGRAAVETLLGDGAEPTDIVVVDTDRANLDAASALGLVTVHGQRDPVERPADRRGDAGVRAGGGGEPGRHRRPRHADGPRALAERADRGVGAGVGERAPAAPVGGRARWWCRRRRPGACWGWRRRRPSVVEVVEDLLTPDAGFAISEREVEDSEVGGSPRHLNDIVLGVVRDGQLHRVDASAVDALEQGDRLLYVRKASLPRRRLTPAG